MDIPVINRIVTNMETPNSFPNPISTTPLLSHLLSFPITHTYIFFKWSALVLALVASFTTLIRSVKVLVFNRSLHAYQQPLVAQDYSGSDYGSDSDSDSESDSDDEPSTSVSDTEQDDGGEEAMKDEDFSVKGCGLGGGVGLRRRRNGSVLDLASLFTTGKNVVKLWDNVGLGLGSLTVDNGNHVLSSLFSGNVVVSAERNLSGRFLRVWDPRAGGRLGKDAAVVAKVNGTGGVILRDDVTGGLTVGDVRKVGSTLVGLTDADVDKWWDADAVSSWADDSVDEFLSCK